jgi:hypothetical protein
VKSFIQLLRRIYILQQLARYRAVALELCIVLLVHYDLEPASQFLISSA